MDRNRDNVLKITSGTRPKPTKVPAAGKPQTLDRKVANDRIAANTPQGDTLRILPVEADDRPLPAWSPPETLKRCVPPRPPLTGRPQTVAGSCGSTEAPAYSPAPQMPPTVLPTQPEIPKPSAASAAPSGAPTATPNAAPNAAQAQQELVSKQAYVLEHLLIPSLLLQANGCHGAMHVSAANEFMKKFRAAADDPTDPIEGSQLELVTLTVHRVARLHAAAELATAAESKRDLNRAAKDLTGEIPKLIDTLTKYRLSRRPESQQSRKQASKTGHKPVSGAESPEACAQKEAQSAPPSSEANHDQNDCRQGGGSLP